MHRLSFESPLRALGAAVAVAIVALAAITMWSGASAQDATPSPGASPVAGGCARVSERGEAGTPAPNADCVEISMHDIYFGANLITLPANTDVTVFLPNEGAAMHSFVVNDHNNEDVENLDINVDANPGETAETTINAPAGTYYFWCDVPGHEAAGMWGILRVEDGADISAQSVDDPREA